MYIQFQKKEKLQQSIPITQNRNTHNKTSTALVQSTVSKSQINSMCGTIDVESPTIEWVINIYNFKF